MNEWEFTAEVASWINEILASNPTLPFSRVKCEQVGEGSRKRRDLTLLDKDQRIVLTGEVKLPYRQDGGSPYNASVVREARTKARRAKASFFFTWNVNEFVLWETEALKISWQDEKYRSWEVTSIHREGHLELPMTARSIRAWLPLFLSEFAQIIEMHTMNETDIHIFLEMAQSTQYYALFYTAIFTGMRRSELLALRWQDVDLLLLQVSVKRSLHQVKGGRTVFRQPKTEKSRRLIALTPSTASLLQEYRDSQNILRGSLGYPKLTDTDLVFCQYDGKPYLPNTVTHNWIKLVRQAGLRGIRLHDARHTHASLMLKQGIHPKIVQERLGHSSIQITLDTYSHVAPGLQQSAAETFDNIVLPKKPVSELV